MQHVSTYNSHLQAKLRTVFALQGGCAHLGSHMSYCVFAAVFFIHNMAYIYYAIISRVKCVACAKKIRFHNWRKNEAQPPYKQKVETYRSTSGRKKNPPPPPPHSNRELQSRRTAEISSFAHATHLTLLIIA